ncbi:MAG TPA: extracellular solute-binding protein [Paenibacillus sp.]
MRRSFFIIFVCCALLVTTLTGCNDRDIVPAVEVPASSSSGNLSAEPVELELWSYYSGLEPAINAFEKKYPNVSVKMKTFGYDAYVSAYLHAIADGVTPDIMVSDSEQFGQFTAINGLENLLDYGAEKYRLDFSEHLWRSNLSHTETKLIGFPVGTSPLVTYYRPDIMEQYGFPSDPEQLGKFMETPENWIAIAKALKNDDRYITQWAPEVVQIFESTQGLFDSRLNFSRNNDNFLRAINIGKQIHNNGLAASIDIWTPSGVRALKDGTIAMLYLGTWGAAQIEEWAPELAGKWRETRLPFNQYGWVNSTNLMMPSAAKHKEWSWKFIEFCVTEWSKKEDGNGVPAYIPARGNPKKLAKENDYYGGQKLYVLHEGMVQKMKEYKLTPLDVQVRKIWKDQINVGIERNEDTQGILDQTEQIILMNFGKEITILQKK